jgi:3-methyladenine DNA glycosylase AlkD
MNQTKDLIHNFQQKLDQVSSTNTKEWWEKYLKHVIQFRGVGIPKIREMLSSWRTKSGIESFTKEEQLELALAFFQESFAEDKLSGILLLQYYLYDQFDWRFLIKRYETLFDEKLIFDWNTNDWFCIRVLGPTIAKYGIPCAEEIVKWKDAKYLWQARSSVVAFVKVSSNKNYYPFMQETCQVLIKREERFAKTAVGWILRDISKHDINLVLDFINNNIQYFTNESLKNATKYLDQNIKRKFLQKLKSVS